jgi:hypothetical protein
MSSREMTRRATGIGVFVLPLILVKIVGSVLGTGSPVGAEAAPVVANDLPVPIDVTGPLAWTASQFEAAEYAAALRDQAFGVSPMFHPKAGGPVDLPEATDGPRPQLQVTVTGIMDTATGAIAFIAGGAYRVGDLFQEAWRITAIDSVRRSVEFSHVETGSTEVRHVPMPTE